MNELEFHISQLAAVDFPTRRRSAELLGGFGEPAVIKPLLKLLSDDYWQVRNTVVDAIVKIRDKTSITPLIEFLRDEDPSLRNSAMSVLHEMGEDVVAPMTKLLLADISEDVRIFCANTLGRMREPHAVAGLVKGLADADENVRFACAEGLGRLGHRDAVLPLIDAMNKEETWSRFAYITALGLIGDELACPSLLTLLEDEILAFPSVISLGQIGDISALLPLAEKLGAGKGDEITLHAIVVALARIEKKTTFFSKVERNGFLHSEVVEVLKKTFNHSHMNLLISMVLGDDNLESESAQSLLRFVQDPIPVERLFQFLTDETREEEIRDLILKQGKSALKPVLEGLRVGTVGGEGNHLINILSLIGSEENVRELAPYLNSPVSETVCDALKAVGLLNGRDMFPRMAEFLSSQHENVQNAALAGISLLKPMEWLYEKALELAASHNVFVRRAGLRILGFTSLSGSLDLLVSALGDEAAVCRAAAMQSLGYIGARDKSILLNDQFFAAIGRILADEEKPVRLEAVLAFARINDPKTFKYLIDMLEGEDREVQNHVIHALGRCRVTSASEKLCDMLEGQDNTEQAIIICSVLARCGKPEAIPYLLECVDSVIPELASEAIRAVAMVGGENIADEVTPFLWSRSWLVSVAAVNALVELKQFSAAPLIAKLAHDKIAHEDGPIIVHTCLKALAKIAGPGEMKAVLELIGNPMCEYEAFAAAFGILCRENGKLFNLKEINEPVARRLACVAAGFSQKDEYRGDVIALLGDPYPSVRRAAALALTVVPQRQAGSAGGSPRQGGSVLSKSLSDPDPWVVNISKLTSQEKQ